MLSFANFACFAALRETGFSVHGLIHRFLWSGCTYHNWAYNHRWTARKLEEKLNYLPNNPVKRGLVKEPGDGPWSRWRFYFLRDASLLATDRVP